MNFQMRQLHKIISLATRSFFVWNQSMFMHILLILHMERQLPWWKTPPQNQEVQHWSLQKKTISSFQPNRLIPWNEQSSSGNPTCSSLVNDSTKGVKKYKCILFNFFIFKTNKLTFVYSRLESRVKTHLQEDQWKYLNFVLQNKNIRLT